MFFGALIIFQVFTVGIAAVNPQSHPIKSTGNPIKAKAHYKVKEKNIVRPALFQNTKRHADSKVPKVITVDHQDMLPKNDWPSSQDLLVLMYPEREKDIRLGALNMAVKRGSLVKVVNIMEKLNKYDSGFMEKVKGVSSLDGLRNVLVQEIEESKNFKNIGSYYNLLMLLKVVDVEEFEMHIRSKSDVAHTSIEEINHILASNSVESLMGYIYKASITSAKTILKIISDYLQSGSKFVDVPSGITALEFAQRLIRKKILEENNRFRQIPWENAGWSLAYISGKY